MQKPDEKTLSKAQLELLGLIAANPVFCAEYYPPAKALFRRGLAKWKGDRLEITDAGRSTLSPEPIV